MQCDYCGRAFDSRKAVATHRRFRPECAVAWANDQNQLREQQLSCGQVVCAICGERLKTITNTHLSRHGLTMAEYKNRYREELFSQDVLDVQRDRREETLKTKYTEEERRKLHASGIAVKVSKHGSLEAYHKWLLLICPQI